MQPVITPEESARLDAASPEPITTLMDRAGFAVSLAAADAGAGYGTRVAVLAGVGNNGGDGYVAGHYLARRGCAVTAYALGDAKTDAAAWATERAATSGVRMRPLVERQNADIVVDALFGAGFRGELPASAAAWTTHPAPVISVDIPSGLDAGSGTADGPCFTAARTVTFHALKPGHVIGEGPDKCGRIEVADIGLVGGTPEMLICEEADAPRPPRDRAAHKWSAGAVAVVGGAPGLTGAPMLTANAALEMGAGAATIITPRALQPAYAAMSAGVLTTGIGSGSRFTADDAGAVLDAAARFDVLIVGPGLGPGQEPLVQSLVRKWEGRLIVDADALNALRGPGPFAERSHPTVLTPHSGEYRRLTGAEPHHRHGSTFAIQAKATLVLKGNPTFVVGDLRWVVTTGGPELATIGTGDVLAGMIGALWARGLDAPTAARSAVYWHGRAGADLAAAGGVTAEKLAASVGRYAW